MEYSWEGTDTEINFYAKGKYGEDLCLASGDSCLLTNFAQRGVENFERCWSRMKLHGISLFVNLLCHIDLITHVERTSLSSHSTTFQNYA